MTFATRKVTSATSEIQSSLAKTPELVAKLQEKLRTECKLMLEVPRTMQYDKARDEQAALELNERAVRNSPTAPTWSPEWNESVRHIEEAYFNGGDFLAVYFGSKLAAMGGLQRVDEKTAIIKKMRVDPDFRGMGLAKQLMQVLEARAQELGYALLRMEVQEINAPMRNICALFGYADIGMHAEGALSMRAYEKILPSEPRMLETAKEQCALVYRILADAIDVKVRSDILLGAAEHQKLMLAILNRLGETNCSVAVPNTLADRLASKGTPKLGVNGGKAHEYLERFDSELSKASKSIFSGWFNSRPGYAEAWNAAISLGIVFAKVKEACGLV